MEIANILSYIINFVLGATATIAFLSLKKYKKTYTTYFIYFLIYVFVLEIIAYYPRFFADIVALEWIKNNKFLSSNYWYYTIFWVIGSTVFYTLYFQTVLQIKLFKSILKYGRYVFLLVSFFLIFKDYNRLFNNDFNVLDYFNTVLVIGSVVLVFLEVLLTNKIITFYRNINFYIASSVLVWWLITLPLSIYSEYYNENDMDYVYLNRSLMSASNIFMYTCFAIGLIVSKPQLKND